jgi:hypothetical protein
MDPATGMVTVVLSGPITLELMQDAFEQVLQHAEFKKSSDALWDLREAEIPEAPTSELIELVSFIKSKTLERGRDYKVALLVSSSYHYGLARMYEAYADLLPVKIKTFRDLGEATAWLAGDRT